VFALGPAPFQLGLLTVLVLRVVARRLPVWSPVLVLLGFVAGSQRQADARPIARSDAPTANRARHRNRRDLASRCWTPANDRPTLSTPGGGRLGSDAVDQSRAGKFTYGVEQPVVTGEELNGAGRNRSPSG
jgi:hypothetical protein